MPRATDYIGEYLVGHAPMRYAIYGALMALVLGILASEILHPYLYLVGDSFTYFDMVRRFWETGLLYSYSGVDHATGIHPAYYFLLLPFYPLFGMQLPAWSFAINGVLLAGGLYLCYRGVGRTTAAVMILVLSTPFGLAAIQNGM